MSGSLHRLVYCSCLAAGHGQDHLAAILETSRRRNAASGLTGALLHAGATIVQVLEGALQPLEETYDRISADLRHGGLTLLQFVPIDARSFPDWRMACLPAAAIERVWPDATFGAALGADDIPRLIAALAATLPPPEQRAAA